jgi:hypothetical protein
MPRWEDRNTVSWYGTKARYRKLGRGWYAVEYFTVNLFTDIWQRYAVSYESNEREARRVARAFVAGKYDPIGGNWS